MWVLGTELRTFGKTTPALKRGAISPGLEQYSPQDPCVFIIACISAPLLSHCKAVFCCMNVSHLICLCTFEGFFHLLFGYCNECCYDFTRFVSVCVSVLTLVVIWVCAEAGSQHCYLPLTLCLILTQSLSCWTWSFPFPIDWLDRECHTPQLSCLDHRVCPVSGSC